MKRDYQMRIYQYANGDTFDWVVEYPDLLGCVGAGDTVEEAIAEAQINKELWLEAADKIGKVIPEPSTSFSDDYSGKFNLRLPTSLHRDLSLQAEAEGVSLNALCSTLLAKGVYSNSTNNTNKSSESIKITVASSTNNQNSQNNPNNNWVTRWSESAESNRKAC